MIEYTRPIWTIDFTLLVNFSPCSIYSQKKHSSGVILALYLQHSEWSQRDRLSKLSSFSLILINHREGFGVWPEKPTKVLNYRFDNALNVQFECGKKTWKKCPEYSVLNLRVPVRTSDLEIIFGFDPSNNSGPTVYCFNHLLAMKTSSPYENSSSARQRWSALLIISSWRNCLWVNLK